MDIETLLKAWRKAPNEALRALILAHDDEHPLEALRDLESLRTGELAALLKTWSTRAKDPAAHPGAADAPSQREVVV